MSNRRFFNRVGYVRIVDGNGNPIDKNEELYGLNFKFSCEITAPPSEGRKAMAEVGILGLTGEKVYMWSSYCNGSTPEDYAAPGMDAEHAARRIRYVEVYAGYESQASRGTYLNRRDLDGQDATGKLELRLPKPLFVLPIAGAWPTMPPDMWLNISAYPTEQVNGAWYEISLPSKPGGGSTYLRFKQVCQTLADVIGAKLRWEVHQEVEDALPIFANGWSGRGTIMTITRELHEASNENLRVYVGYEYPDIGKKILFVEHNPERIQPKSVMDLSERWNVKDIRDLLDKDRSDFLNRRNRGPVISVENGMIGLPKVVYGDGKAGQIEVTSLLRNDLEPDDVFSVRSSIIRNANDTFRVTKVKHVGEFRGNQWQTTITGQRVKD